MNQNEFNKVKKKINDQMNRYANKIVVGQYNGNIEPERNEGDIWYDSDGKQWTIKNGLRQSISKLQDVRTPWFCPSCEHPLNHKLDTKFYRIRGKCHDCVVKEETKMRMEGTWKDYEEKIEMENQMGWLKDRIVELTYYHDSLRDVEIQNFDDQGNILMIEKWSIPLEQVQKDLREEVVEMNRVLKNLEKEYEERFGTQTV